MGIAFGELGLARIEADCRVENAASARVLLRKGFTQFGLFRRKPRHGFARRESLPRMASLPATASERRMWQQAPGIEAPHEGLVVVPRAGHDPDEPMMAAQLQVLRGAAARLP